MGILAWLVFGLIAGAIAQLIVPGNDAGGGGLKGIAITIGIGVIGAFVGGFIGTALGYGDVTGFNGRSFLIAIIGAIVFLFAWRAVSRGDRRLA